MKIPTPNFHMISGALGIALIVSLAGLTSCTITVSPDGSKSAAVDAPAAIRVLEIIAAK